MSVVSAETKSDLILLAVVAAVGVGAIYFAGKALKSALPEASSGAADAVGSFVPNVLNSFANGLENAADGIYNWWQSSGSDNTGDDTGDTNTDMGGDNFGTTGDTWGDN